MNENKLIYLEKLEQRVRVRQDAPAFRAAAPGA
jgi:hypothetical protein